MSASWQRDPLGRAELRYYDGNAWTLNVSTNGVQSTEPAGSSLVAPAGGPYGQAPVPQYGGQGFQPHGGYAQPASDPGRGRLLAAGVLSIISGVVWLFIAILVLSVLSSDAGGFVDDVFGGAITVLFFFLLVLGGGFIAAGWGACANKAWGQISVIVLGAVGVLLWLYALVTGGDASSLIPVIWFGAHVGLAVSARPGAFSGARSA